MGEFEKRIFKMASKPYMAWSKGRRGMNIPIWLEDGSLRHLFTNFLSEEEAISLYNSFSFVEPKFIEVTWEDNEIFSIKRMRT